MAQLLDYVIRGITAPASLKQGPMKVHKLKPELRYPGHNCPGLIEALYCQSFGSAKTVRLSGA
ncbi:protein of unknown function [Candidatus Methylocalor cossyra]|uniref:Formylmethanofuran dehydrogenase subunit E domain-containing protein n=1 Tax=Candidatus Methylocalor cossyra TaxID=3108543 RepID=A0ABP1C863_9GAMM